MRLLERPESGGESRGVGVLTCGGCCRDLGVFLSAGDTEACVVYGDRVFGSSGHDVIGFQFGVHYGDFWGHRGFTHSLVFAVLLASVLVAAGSSSRMVSGISRLTLWSYLFLATASHGLLDSLTDGGLGVAFFSPFDNHRYFLPWRPIRVSPIGVSRFFSDRGLAVLQSELLWIWLPSLLLVLGVFALRRISSMATKERA